MLDMLSGLFGIFWFLLQLIFEGFKDLF